MTGLASWAADINVNSISDFPSTLVSGNTYILKTDLVVNRMTWVSGDVTLDLNGHVLDRNLTVEDPSGCCLYISRGSLTIMDSNPSSTHTGSLAAYTGGIITGAYNEYSSPGGAVRVQSGTLYLRGGTIAGNRCGRGAGVFVDDRMVMTGGKICGNISNDDTYYGGGQGGGVMLSYASTGGSTFTMTGGEISGNLGGGLCAYSSANPPTINIGGTAKIYNNTLNDGTTPCNLYLQTNINVNITSALESGANIWVSKKAGEGTFTSGYAAHNSSDAPSAYFSSDNSFYEVALDGSGEVQLAAGTTTLTANRVDDNYWATYYRSDVNCQADANTIVYAATRDGSTLTLVEVPNRVVKADEGVVLMSTEQTITLTNTTIAPTSGTYTGNVLSGVDAVAAQASGYTYYVLSCENSTLGFYKYNSGNTLGAHKAYLAVPAADARGFFLFGDDATGVQELENTEVADMESCYNLLGCKVIQPNRGLYILNGKKVIIK